MIQNAKNLGEEVGLTMLPAGHRASPVVDIMTKGMEHIFTPACHETYRDLGVTQNSTRTFMCPLISAEPVPSHFKIKIEEKQP